MDDILTLQELHQYLKIPKPTLYQLAQTGRIPAAKVGRHWRFQRRSIDRWLQAQERRRKPSNGHVVLAPEVQELSEVAVGAV